MKNPYKINGKPIVQFQGEAKGWDVCLESVKRDKIFYGNSYLIDMAVNDMAKPHGKGYLVFIPEEKE